MGEGKRLHRRDPARTGPVRSFTDLYIPRQRRGGRDTRTNGSPPQDGAESPGQGVGLAYQVIDKHINDGRRAAAMLNGQPYNARTATDLLQEVIERTLRYSTELLPLWLEALTSAVRIEPPRLPSASPGISGADDRDRGDGSTAVAIEMISSRPVTVSFDLRENSERMPLAVLGLRAVERGKPELSDINIEPDPTGGLKLRICIPQSCPPGAFSGVIVNRETGESRGTLTVRVSEQ
jgi:hypothetical protein